MTNLSSLLISSWNGNVKDLWNQVRLPRLLRSVRLIAKQFSQEFHEFGDLQPFKIFLWLLQDSWTLLRESDRCLRSWNFTQWDPGVFLCHFLLATTTPEGLIFLEVFAWLSFIVLQAFLTFLYKEKACTGIPPVYLSVEIPAKVIVLLFYTW